MGKSIIERLKTLEQAIAPDRLVILAEFNGVAKECSVDELEADPKARFVRVISGNDNKNEDVKRILNRMKAEAFELEKEN